MSRTTYVNASGLPDDRQITSAHDLTILGRAVQERFPRYFHYFSTHSFDYAGEVIGNHNHLLGRVDGVDGIKTGYTRASGFNLLTSVHRDGRSLVAVVMGGVSAGARDRYMESLIAQHFASATTTRTATMVADAGAADPIRTASTSPDRRGYSAPAAPEPPVREAADNDNDEDAATPPMPPTRALLAAASNPDAEGEGDRDTVERYAPVATPEVARHNAEHRASAMAAAAAIPVPSAPLHSADAAPKIAPPMAPPKPMRPETVPTAESGKISAGRVMMRPDHDC